MSAVCPNGHRSEATDYCDVCGAPVDLAAQPASSATPVAPPPASAPLAAVACPQCGTENPAEALFCEACGYDFTTGTPARTSAPAAAPDLVAPDLLTPAVPPAATSEPGTGWVAEVWVDPDWYAQQETTDPLPSPGLPEVVPLRRTSVLVGRTSHSRGISPDIACETDTGISRRQAQLTTDGRRWFVEDLDSANGTFVAPASGPVPPDPIPVGVKHELDPDDRIYVGAWTRIVIRPATAEEQQLPV